MKRSKVLALSIAGMVMLSVAGAASYRTFTATERADFTIVMDGKVQKMKDGNGNVINPVVINGSTYLPLKATANLFKKSVQWDGATSTITIDEKISEGKSLLDFMQKVGGTGIFVKDSESLTVDIGDVGVPYDTAIKGWVKGTIYEEYSQLSVELLSFEGDAVFVIRDRDSGVEILRKNVKKGEVCKIDDIDIKNVRNFGFSAEGVEDYYFLNPTVK